MYCNLLIFKYLCRYSNPLITVFIRLTALRHWKTRPGTRTCQTSDFNYPRTTKLTITTKFIEDQLKKVNPIKDNGPDKIRSRGLKECTPQIATYLTVIFNQSLTEQDQVIGSWQDLPKGKRKDSAKYRLLSLTCVIYKVMELYTIMFLDIWATKAITFWRSFSTVQKRYITWKSAYHQLSS